MKHDGRKRQPGETRIGRRFGLGLVLGLIGILPGCGFLIEVGFCAAGAAIEAALYEDECEPADDYLYPDW